MLIKIISLNTLWGGEHMEAMIDFLRNQDANVLCLQEVYNSSDSKLPDRYRTVEVLQQRLNYKYSEFAPAFIHDGPMGKLSNGNAILSKIPIIASSQQYLVKPTKESYEDIPENWPIEPRVLQHAELNDRGINFNIFNMHGIWDLDGDNYSQNRKDMRDKILEAAKGMQNLVITGDTNAKSSNQALLDIAKIYPSVFGPELKSTFNMRIKKNPGYATAAVDLMYISPNIKIISKSVPDVDISDHLPIVVELEISTNNN